MLKSTLIAACAGLLMSTGAWAADCAKMADEKKLAGAARTSFITKCEKDASPAERAILGEPRRQFPPQKASPAQNGDPHRFALPLQCKVWRAARKGAIWGHDRKAPFPLFPEPQSWRAGHRRTA